MKVLHLMRDEKFTKSIVSFYNKFYNSGDHDICYIRTSDCNSMIDQEICLKQFEFDLYKKRHYLLLPKLFKIFKEYDYIIVHSYAFRFILRWLISIKKSVLKKIVWIEFGADLYEWENRYNTKSVIKVLKTYDYRIRNSCKAVVCIFPPDCDYYIEKFPNHLSEVFFAPYCSSVIGEEFLHYNVRSRLEKTVNDRDTIYIQIGQNAQKQLNHIRVLEDLKHLSDEDIKLVIPLSYSDCDGYADKVQEMAERYFPNKTIVLRDFMPKEDYFRLMERVDIGIFCSYRQTGLGNIHHMIACNVKLYMPKDSVMYKFFIEYGIPIQAYEDIADISYEGLSNIINYNNYPGVDDYVTHILGDIDYKHQQWEYIYSNLSKELETF